MGNCRRDQSRRKFIKTAAAAGTLLASGILNPFNAVLIASEKPTDSSAHWWGYGIDIEKCIGCGRCANACKLENNVPPHPFYFRTWVEQYTIDNDGKVMVESPNGGIDGFKQQIEEKEIFKSFFVPKMCNHCHKSPCVQVCPVGATFDTPDGVVLVDENYCIGCSYCVQACPYGCRYIHPEKHVVDKCTLCYHRISKGKTTACVEVCPTQARILGDLNNKKDPIHKFLKDHNCLVLKPHLNTGSKLFYNALSAEVR
ncbi:MAG: 4Fe-4S dicluster domain-containing protein [Bacteroidales bacterium]|nr:4Fe-4S dicluster domain-containing protein [Bacteroidales bacterium]MCF8405325.1 4Fe-4S dicluster domain-containing protein [Bacteroidales bacterium]